LLKSFYYLGNGGLFQVDSHDHADDILYLLVDVVIQCDGGFTGLAIAYDQLPLVTNVYIDFGIDGAFIIQGFTQRIEHPSHQRFASGYGNDPLGPLDDIAFFYLKGFA